MGLLHQPELEPGPHRDLVDALHRLHHEAGRPSLRAIARRAGCSHTTVHHLFTHPRLPAWSLLEMVVPAIGGDPADYRDLWLAATADGAPVVVGRWDSRWEPTAGNETRCPASSNKGYVLLIPKAATTSG